MADLLAPTLSEERGRKRRRTSDDVTSQPAAHNPSSESTTLRGRGRRRSVSRTSLQSDDISKPPTRTMSPPIRKYQKKALSREVIQKRRSQSPSRSRSRDRDRTPRRRRQRTSSRSRSHEPKKGGKHFLTQEESDQRKKSGVEAAK